MTKPKSDTAFFSSDAQLLAELGERLVASRHVALAEVVKNAHDADAKRARVWVAKEKGELVLTIEDDGHGMTEDEFLTCWMTVATISKLGRNASRKYHRSLSGSKGIGRFAVRMLGHTLDLETTAKTGDGYARLHAKFDWNLFTAGKPIDSIGIQYTVTSGLTAKDVGTRLRIGALRHTWTPAEIETVSDALLGIVDPPLFDWIDLRPAASGDPGFTVTFEAAGSQSKQIDVSAGSEILKRYIGVVEVAIEGEVATFSYKYNGLPATTFTAPLVGGNLIGKVTAEIRYFPKRPHVFSGLKSVDGRKARKWLVGHAGIKVYDRGFRIPPYGESEDDWLALSISKAERERNWHSSMSEGLYPAKVRNKAEVSDPLLKIPHNKQLFGAVVVKSFKPQDDKNTDKLQPAMDRQGFVHNIGYIQLCDVIRTAVNLFAVLDIRETAKRTKQEAKAEAKSTRKQLRAAIDRIRGDKSLPAHTRQTLIDTYESVVAQFSRLDDAQERAEQAVETMSLLGVLSGFMTHETTVMLRAVERMVVWLNKVPKERRDAAFESTLTSTKRALGQLRGHLDYAEAFVRGARADAVKSFEVKPQIDMVCGQLAAFASERHIKIENAVPEGLMSPPLVLSVYSGIALNLFTNAIKAVLARGGSGHIRFDGLNDGRWQVLRVSDTGVGVPAELQDRIFEPLFTTTEDSPLGAGMGLGLHIVRRLVRQLKGKIEIADAPDGFVTCFELHLKLPGVD